MKGLKQEEILQIDTMSSLLEPVKFRMVGNDWNWAKRQKQICIC